MAVYTAPTMSFIDTYINAARDNTTRADQRRKDWFEGMNNLVKGGVDSYKFQKRKEILDRADELDRREKEILAEIERLKASSVNGGRTPNFDTFMAGYSPAVNTGRV